MRRRFFLWINSIPTALIIVHFTMAMLALGAILAPFIPSLGDASIFPDVNQPTRAIFGIGILIIIFLSIFFLDEKYYLFTIYFFCAIRISDAIFGGPVIAAFLWFGIALICTYAMARQHYIYFIIEKRIEEKQKEKEDDKSD